MILLANRFSFVTTRRLARMKPYPPLATLLAAAVLREQGHEVALFDATLAAGVDEFVRCSPRQRPAVVGILEDNFNYLTKMCTTRLRDATLEMIGAAHEYGCRVAVNGSDATDHPGAISTPAPTRCCSARRTRPSPTWRRLAGRRRRAARCDRRSGAARSGADEMTAPRRAGSARPRRAAPARLGPARRRRLPPRLEPRARRVFLEHGDLARLSLRLQLVRQADLRPPLHAALAGGRGARTAPAESRRSRRTTSGSPTTSSASTSSWIDGSPTRSSAPAPHPFHHAVARQPDDRPRWSRPWPGPARGGLARRRVRLAEDARRHGQGLHGRRGARRRPAL